MIGFYVNKLGLIGILAAADGKVSYGPWNPQFKVEKQFFWLVLPNMI